VDAADLRAVRDDGRAGGGGDHRRLDLGLRQVDVGYASLRFDAIAPDQGKVGVYAAQHQAGERGDQGVLQRSQRAARDDNLQAGDRRLEQQRDRQAARDDSNVAQRVTAEKFAGDSGRGRTHVEQDAHARLEKVGGRSGDPGLGLGRLDSRFLKRPFNQAGRVERHRAAPDAPDTALRLQRVEVAAHSHGRDAEFQAQLGHAREGTLVNEGAHAVPTLGSARLLDLIRHGSIVATASWLVKSKTNLLSIPKVAHAAP
jgi:hypothetical protein